MTTVVSVPGISTTITEVETGQTVVSTVAGPSTVVSTAAQPGQRGRGVPAGGTTGQVLGKLSNADLDTAWVDETGGGSGAVASVNTQTGVVVLDAADVGADVAGAAAAALVTAESYTGVETARAEAAEGVLSTALSGKAASSALTAEVTRATTAEGVNATAIGAETTRAEGAEATLTSAVTAEATARSNADAAEVIARNAAIATAVAGVLGGAPGALDTLKELADAINDDASFAATVTTALAGKQPLDSDLTAIAALSTTAFGRAFLTMADAAATKTVLALVKGDVGLGSVDNTSDAGKPVSTAQQAALDGKQPLDSDLTTIAALDASTAGALATDGSGWVRKTYAQLKTALGLVKGDVGLGNVDNTSDVNKPVSAAQATADTAVQTAAASDATSKVATEASRATTAEALLAPLASPALTGNPTAPTQTALNSSTRLSTTAYADSAVAVEKARAQTAEALAVQTGTNPASGVSVSTSGLVVVTHTNVQSALGDLDANAGANPAKYSTGTFGKMLVPIILGTPYLVTTATTAPGTRVARGMRMRCDKTGTLKSFTYFVGASSGNALALVTDVGEASSGVYTVLWSSGSTAVATVNTWQKMGDPNLSVVAGQELMFWLVFDNATATYARGGPSSTAPTSLPSDLWPVPTGMTVAWLSCQVTLGSFANPTTISDASVVTQTVPGVFLARIS